MDATDRLTMRDRATLCFPQSVEERFQFLSEHGLKRVTSNPTFVRFESDRAYVNVYHGRKSFEIGLELGLLASAPNEPPYSMSEIIRLVEPDKAAEYRDYATRDASGVREGVQRLAALFHRYADAGVLDASNLFDRLNEQRRTWALDFARDINLTQARRKLDTAWHAKNYVKVVELLEPLRSELTPTELKKLEYAKRELAEQ